MKRVRFHGLGRRNKGWTSTLLGMMRDMRIVTLVLL